MVEVIHQVVAEGRPFLGICLGLQVLFTFSEESGGQECLNIIPGRVKRLPPGVKVPHMGWNQVKQKMKHPLFSGIPDGAYFYFVHSYYGAPDDQSVIAGETSYEVTFGSMLLRHNLLATQFHPEKSGQVGLKLLRNFLEAAMLPKPH
jgi:glutamine amidotransferase